MEKGTYTPASELSTLEKDAYEHLYERGGLLMATEEGSESLPSFLPRNGQVLFGIK